MILSVSRADGEAYQCALYYKGSKKITSFFGNLYHNGLSVKRCYLIPIDQLVGHLPIIG